MEEEREELDHALAREMLEDDHVLALIHLGIPGDKSRVGIVKRREILKHEQEVGISLGYKGEQLRIFVLLELNGKEIEHREERISSLSSCVKLTKARVKQLCDRDFRFKEDQIELREKEVLIRGDEAEIQDLRFKIRKLKEEKLRLIEWKESLGLEWSRIEIETKSNFASTGDGTADKS